MSARKKQLNPQLPPRTQEAVTDYFSRLCDALPAHAVGQCREAVDDMKSYLLEKLHEGAGSPEQAEKIFAEWGTPEDIAAALAESVGKEKPSPLSGKMLGVPYELRPPTAERAALRWWNPMEPRLFVPRVFGIGWTVNFAAVAVRLGLIKPDDEDVPFGLVPERRLMAALALPLVLAAGMAVMAAVFQAALPDFITDPATVTGTAGRVTSKWTALGAPLVMTAAGIFLAIRTWIRRRPPLSRVAAGALGTALSALSMGSYGYYVSAARGGPAVALLISSLAAAFVLPFALFVVLSRMGRTAEQKRDLEGNGNKGGTND